LSRSARAETDLIHTIRQDTTASATPAPAAAPHGDARAEAAEFDTLTHAAEAKLNDA
jgi:hypothetical protein